MSEWKQRFGDSRLQRWSYVLLIGAAVFHLALNLTQRSFSVLALETFIKLKSLFAPVMFLWIFVFLIAEWGKYFTIQKSRLRREAEDATRAEIYLNEHTNDWK